MPQRIGILHPGEMGLSLAAAAQRSGHTVYWAAEGRSPATQARAAQLGLRNSQTIAQLCAACSAIVSVCPPHAAEDVASQVMAAGFSGLYLEANAIAPQRAIRLSQAMAAAGIQFVDGGIIGGPAWAPGQTWLYLAGAQAQRMAALFTTGPLEVRVLSPTVGQASALKMCYAAYSKGTTALLGAILATAEQLGVREALNHQWAQDDPEFATRAAQRVRRATAKAWRFAGEMDEIADTFRAAGLPGDFHAGAAQIFQRLAQFKDEATTTPLEAVLAALVEPQASTEAPSGAPGPA